MKMKINTTPRNFSGTGTGTPRATSAARSGLCLSMGVIALFSLQDAQADPGTWTNVNGGSWDTSTNWLNNIIADGQNNLANFSTLDLTGDRTVTLDSARDIGRLSFGDTAPSHNWTLNSPSNFQLTLKNTGGNTGSITVVNQTQTTTINLVLNNLTPEPVQKLGLGTLILTAANIGSANTGKEVIAGTLLVNNATGSGTGSGTVGVGPNGVLGGSGTIIPGTTGNAVSAISVSGVLAPGGSIGTIGTLTLNMGSTTKVATMLSGSSFLYELGAPNAEIGTIALNSSDLLRIAGAASGDLVFNNNNINFQGTGSALPNAVGFYKLFDTDLNASTWSGLTFDPTTGLISNGLTFTNLGAPAAGLTGNLFVGTIGNGGDVGDIYLQAIPEPASALLGSLGVLCLLRRRRSA